MSAMDRKPNNTALVVGGGPAGMQSALALAGRGHDVVLVEKAPALGGLFPLLDNQFPTQSCGVCFMACDNPTYCPFVQCDLHENVEVVNSATVAEAAREGGVHTVKLSIAPTCVDDEKCTDCGACEAVCPVEVAREFGDGLETRKAIYRHYPKAVGKGFVVDKENCTRCGACVEACDANAIDLDLTGSERTVEAGAVILAPGAKVYRAEEKGEFGYGRYDNVLSAVKFERMLAAGSPSGGEAVRPSDGETPQSIGFVQCVGSRDPANGRAHCSSVCCMFTLKQALFAKERHLEARVVIYYMDLRAFGKDYERYIRLAEAAGIELVRAMPSVVRCNPATGDIEINVSGDGVVLRTDTHSMLILATGFGQGEEGCTLAETFGLKADLNGIDGDEFAPGVAGEGLFVCGNFRGAKDIPETTQEGSLAAGLAAMHLERPGVDEQLPVGPTPVDFRDEEPKIGVVLCGCEGYNEAKVDFGALTEQVNALPEVAFVETVAHGCAKAGMGEVRDLFTKNEPNRLIFAACTNRIVENLHTHQFKQMGVHAGVLDFVNLREACMTGPDAARDAVAASVKKAHFAGFAPVKRESLERTVLVIGGGAAGMRAAVDLARLGHSVHLVEKTGQLGGNLKSAAFTVKGNDPRELWTTLEEAVRGHENITVHTGAAITSAQGRIGSYRTTVESDEGTVEILHGATLLATGGSEVKPSSYGYGKSPKVVTQKEMEGLLHRGEFSGGNVVMVQCVESREEAENCRPHCSRVCCTHALKNARRMLQAAPETEVTVLYRDLRAYGDFEKVYQAAREEGVVFTAFGLDSRPSVSVWQDEVTVSYREPSASVERTLTPDYLVLSVGMAPDAAETARLAELYGVETDAQGFFVEKNAKAATTDFAKAGMYAAGLCHAPKHIEESLVQAGAAAARASAVLSARELAAPDNPSYVVKRVCSRCGLCVDACPYGARSLDLEANVAVVDEIVCRACGGCTTACPNKAAQQYGSTPAQLLAGLDELL